MYELKTSVTRSTKDLVEQFKNAVVYGTSVKHQPQYVGLSHVLNDEDVVTILKK